MKPNTNAAPEIATGNDQLANITDKKGYAARWHGSTRWIDSLLATGLPHLKIGSRRVRILIPEADAWMHEKFGVQRHGPLAPVATTSTEGGNE